MRRRGTLALPLLACALLACGEPAVTSAVGRLDVAPAEVDFGPSPLGHRVERSVSLANTGRVAATLAVTGLVPPFAGPERVRVPAGGSVTVEFAFVPSLAEPARATVVFDSPDHGPIEVELRGEGVEATLAIEPSLDFGRVRVGASATAPLEVRNLAALPTPRFNYYLHGQDAEAFTFVRRVTGLDARETSEFVVEFAPTRPGTHRATLAVTACPDCEPAFAILGGRGVEPDLRAVPSALNFRNVPPGTGRTLAFVLENRGGWPAAIAAARVEGDGFGLDTTPLPLELGEGEAVTLSATFAAPAEGEFEGRLVFVDSLGTDLLAVPLRGHGGGVVLAAEPASVDLGRVPLGWTGGTALVLKNVGETLPVELVSATVVGGPGWTVATPRLPAAIDGSGLRLEVSFSALVGGPSEATLVLASSDPDWPETRVPLRASTVEGPCEIVASPDPLRFGAVPAGEEHFRPLELANVGTDACFVGDVALDPAGDPGFFLYDAPATQELGPGEAVTVLVGFSESETAPAVRTTTLRYRTSSAAAPERAVEVSAWPLALAPVAVPNPVYFASVPAGRTDTREFRILWPGTGRLRLLDVRFVDGSSPAFSFDQLPPLLDFTRDMQPAVRVAYAPLAEGRDVGQVALSFEWLVPGFPDPVPFEEPLLVSIQGTSRPCGVECEPPVAVCPPAATGTVGRPFTLLGSGVDPNGDPLACDWAVVAAPPGSSARPFYPALCRTDFIPDLVGDYTILLKVRDSMGNVGDCETTYTALAPQSGLWVELAWDVANDVDLHLLHPAAGDPTLVSSWGHANLDCHYLNQHPEWDAVGPADDPSLDRDDVSGTGPENIRLDVPSTAHPYHVGAVFFRQRTPGVPLTATTNVYCQGVLVGRAETPLGVVGEVVFVGTVQFDGAGACGWTDATGAPGP